MGTPHKLAPFPLRLYKLSGRLECMVRVLLTCFGGGKERIFIKLFVCQLVETTRLSLKPLHTFLPKAILLTNKVELSAHQQSSI